MEIKDNAMTLQFVAVISNIHTLYKDFSKCSTLSLSYDINEIS